MYYMPSDNANHPLISEGLPGCLYRMTSYSEQDIGDVEPAFGVQLHHPRFLECIGAPESARLLGRAGRLDPNDDKTRRYDSRLAIAA